ncbi:50S ribosomal protein L10 [Rohdeia mirabilis]
MPSVLNTMLLRELTDTYKSADSLVVISMNGLSMNENEALRNQLAAEAGVRLRMVPNRLARRALAEVGLEFDRDVFAGANIGVMISDAEGAISAAKVVKGHGTTKAGKVAFRGGALEGNVLGADDAKAMAEVPDKDTLRAKILGCLIGPGQGLVRVIAANPSGLARVIQAHVDQGEGGE